MRLTRALSNPERGSPWARLNRMRGELVGQAELSGRPRALIKRRHGVVQAAVVEVLRDASGAMRAVEIHADVEQRLGSEVPSATVGSFLSVAGRSADCPVQRVGYGRYRIIDPEAAA